MTKQELDDILKTTDFSRQVERVEASGPGQARIAELEDQNKRLREALDRLQLESLALLNSADTTYCPAAAAATESAVREAQQALTKPT